MGPLLHALALACATAAQDAPAAPAPEPAAERPPHVVLILADDLGMGDLGCYDPGSKVPTPHMDAVAAAGLRFTDAHSPSGVCTPTRYGLLTGRYAWRTRLERGVLWGDSRSLIDPARLTLAEMLQQRGYRTACFGKWHLGLGSTEPVDYSKPLDPAPPQHGFDESLVFPGSLDMAPYVWVRGDRAEAQPSVPTVGERPVRWGGDGFWRAGLMAPGFDHEGALERVFDEGIAFLERGAPEAAERPLFLYLPLTAPHTPWLPVESARGRSGAGVYGDFVCQIDDGIGRVLAALERLELADDTLLVVTSDNGSHWEPSDIQRYGHRANMGWRGMKADIWEAGHRVPFLVRWPGVAPAGEVRDELLCLVDLFASLAAITGFELPDDAAEDSLDLSPLLRGAEPDPPPRTALVLHSFEGMFAVREGSWKLCFGLGSGGFSEPVFELPGEGQPPGQLYDLARDPGETTNRFADEPERVERMARRLQGWMQSGRSR